MNIMGTKVSVLDPLSVSQAGHHEFGSKLTATAVGAEDDRTTGIRGLKPETAEALPLQLSSLVSGKALPRPSTRGRAGGAERGQ
jgi:hypothetical protein